MSAIYDVNHNRYLIEKYAVTTTPGLKVLESNSLISTNIKVLAGGISNFSDDLGGDLPSVKDELNSISNVVPTKTLLNDELTIEMLHKQINYLSFPIVHLATHGDFGPQAKDTFIILWENQKVDINELGKLLRVDDPTRQKDIQLLIMSACQTAAGNDKAILGMAGTAIQVGASRVSASK